jgi:soluble lytic murein transglycosylase
MPVSLRLHLPSLLVSCTHWESHLIACLYRSLCIGVIAVLLLSGLACEPYPDALVAAPSPTATSFPSSPLAGGSEGGAAVPPTPSATPSLTDTGEAMPRPYTAPLAPSATPSPTPPPMDRFASGRQAQTNGDYTRAIVEYQALLQDPGTPAAEAREARLRLGQCQILSGDYKAAVATLSDLVQAHPDAAETPVAYFYLAQAYEGLEAWDEAIAAYRRYLEARDVIADKVYELIGNIALKKEDWKGALEAYQAGLAAAGDSGSAVYLRERIAEVYLRMKEHQKAIAQYDAILSVARIPAYRARILRLAGLAYVDWGHNEEGYARFKEAVALYPATYDAYLALVELVNAGVVVDEYQRGIVDYFAGAYDPAIRAFQRYLSSAVKAYRGDAYYYLALSYQKSGNYNLAINNFQTLIAQYPGHRHWGDAWLEEAKSYALAGKVEQAVALCRELVSKQPDHPQAPSALWQAGQLLEENGDLATAAELYAELSQRYPQDTAAPAALLRAGLARYRLKAYDAAAQAWQRVIAGYPESEAYPAALFWLGKALLASGDEEAAQSTWRKAMAEAPLNFYGLRAALMLSSTTTSATPPAAIIDPPAAAPPANDALARSQAEAWLRTWITSTVEGPYSALLPELEQSAAFRRAEELRAVGLRTEALEEYETVRDAWIEDLPTLYAMALAFGDRGASRLSIGCAERLIRLSPTGPARAPIYLQRLAYPTYFSDLVISEARAQKLDPMLLYALIRQESLFEPSAGSRAGARGLMQVIPDTGDYVAGLTGWDEYSHEDLWKPYVNVFFGAWYFAKMLKMFDGNLFAALAAYNAGPGNAIRWYQAVPDDVDLLIEAIDLKETRYYVETVYEQYAMYTAIYSGVATKTPGH